MTEIWNSQFLKLLTDAQQSDFASSVIYSPIFNVDKVFRNQWT